MSEAPILVLSEELVSKTRDVVERRRQIQALLQKAEDSRSDVKPDIYQRVTTDYNSRLADVAAEYYPLRDEMIANLERIRGEESRLRSTLDGINDLLEELRFRARLGEFSKDELALKEKESKGNASEIESLIATIEKTFATASNLLGPDMDSVAAAALVGQDSEPDPEPQAEPMAAAVDGAAELQAASARTADSQPNENAGEHHGVTQDESQACAEQQPADAEQSNPPVLEEIASEADSIDAEPVVDEPIVPDAELGSDTVFLGKPLVAPPPAAEHGNAEARAAVLKSSKGGGKEWKINSQGLTLGRSDKCDVKIDGRTVSRRHAVINLADGSFYIEDISSGGGVEVNRKRVEKRQQLSSGDKIQIALAVFVFEVTSQ